ncbi:MAG: hypothetical protein IJH36_09975 [Clostridia bacterium]|nr:hypothetical protein [Clostridia bacterium]
MRYTKVYPTTGIITIDASQFGVDQETVDTTIRNSEPIKAAVERLKEFEDEAETSYEVSKVEKKYYGGMPGSGLNT